MCDVWLHRVYKHNSNSNSVIASPSSRYYLTAFQRQPCVCVWRYRPVTSKLSLCVCLGSGAYRIGIVSGTWTWCTCVGSFSRVLCRDYLLYGTFTFAAYSDKTDSRMRRENRLPTLQGSKIRVFLYWLCSFRLAAEPGMVGAPSRLGSIEQPDKSSWCAGPARLASSGMDDAVAEKGYDL
ncbi:hypothetical protein K445DRAFT_12242 [Daldinia sp. EC12]|nr:hypothetical protein K445DRAFT_12242 [Daldinia sp. EC12]